MHQAVVFRRNLQHQEHEQRKFTHPRTVSFVSISNLFTRMVNIFTLLDNALSSPRSEYSKRVRDGLLREDTYQELIVERLQILHDELKKYEQPSVPEDFRPPSSSSLVS